MRERDYLKEALEEGLMFTEHPVKFNPFSDDMHAAQNMENYSLGRLMKKAEAIGARKEMDLNDLVFGLGSISGNISMICFTEVHESRGLSNHFLQFGAYGVVVKRKWLEDQGGDRVLYVGAGSAVTTRLHRLFVDHQISCLHIRNGEVLHDKRSLEPILDLLAYVQDKDQLAEVEWRIVGRHDSTEARRVNGSRIPLPLPEIDAVLVQNDEDKAGFEAILGSLAGGSGVSKLPPVLVQPSTLPPAS